MKKTNVQDSEWQTVKKRGRGESELSKGNSTSPQKPQKKQFIIPTENRFLNLSEAVDDPVEMKNTDESPIHTCQGCNFRFMTKNILDDHKKNAHRQKN